MQPTELQVQRSLEALRRADLDDEEHGEDRPVADVPSELVRLLSQEPPVRSDRLAEVRQRLEDGEQPSAEALAHRMVGRLVCDRLR